MTSMTMLPLTSWYLNCRLNKANFKEYRFHDTARKKKEKEKAPTINSIQSITCEKLPKAAASFKPFLHVTIAQFGSKSSLPNYSTTFSTAPTLAPQDPINHHKMCSPYLPLENETLQ